MPKLFNLKDKKIGDLVPKEYLGYDKYKNRYWLCECVCGKQVKVRSTVLISGKKTHCGCKNYLKLNLINKRFGDLMVKEYLGYDKYKNRLWLCECTCGNTIKLRSTLLTTGKKTNCGCKTTNKLVFKNKKIGDLVPKEITGINKYGDKVWLCECVCGNTVKVSTKMLKWGLKTHCGCKNKQEIKQETTKHIEKIQMIQTEHKTVRADDNVFTICDNDLASFDKMKILDKKNLILKLTQKTLEEVKSSETLDLFLTFLTGRKSNLGYLY